MKIDIDLIRSESFKMIVESIVKPCSWKKVVPITVFPFEDKDYNSQNMKNKESLNNFNLVSKINVIYDIDQHIYGILNLNNTDFIVHVDNEFTIKIVGDTESNWLYLMFDLHDHQENFEIFMQECEKKLGIPIKNPDFDGLYAEIEENFLELLIFGN